MRLQVVCPECKDVDAEVVVLLSDLPKCRCESCGGEFTAAQAAALFSKLAEQWAKVGAWIDKAPR